MKERKELWPGWRTVRLIGYGSDGDVYEVERDAVPVIEKAAVRVITIPEDDLALRDLINEYGPEGAAAKLKAQRESVRAQYELLRLLRGSEYIVNCDGIRVEEHTADAGYDIFIMTELLKPLTETLPEDPRAVIADETVIRLGTDLCRALEDCAKNGVVHGNIGLWSILRGEKNYKLGGFSAAWTDEDVPENGKTLRDSTRDFMPPEMQNGSNVDARSDIYSLGMVMYLLLNERRIPFLPVKGPFDIREVVQAKEKRLNGEALPAPAHGSDGLKKIVRKACAFDPAERYQSAAEMRRELEAETQKTASKSESEPGKSPKSGKGKKILLACIVCAVVAALLYGRCPKCHSFNIPFAVYCEGCGAELH